MANPKGYYVIWACSLNFGDTPGVFNSSSFTGLILQIPITLTYVPTSGNVSFLLHTTDVEIFNNNTHPVYWNWTPGTALSNPIGYVDDKSIIPTQPEYHLLTVPPKKATIDKHTITIIVNQTVSEGLKDDFVLLRALANNSIGAKIGW